jgi:hypothetical protein
MGVAEAKINWNRQFANCIATICAIMGGGKHSAKQGADCCAVCAKALLRVRAACGSILDRRIPVNAAMPKIGYSQHNNGAV